MNVRKLTDMQLAFYWQQEIENPCSAKINGQELNFRQDYINEVGNNVIPILSNPFAIKLLKETIKKYVS